MNEILIREHDLNLVKSGVYVDGELLENYVGDGLLLATSIGSTAYNLSLGGSIVYGNLHTLQIVSVAPLNTSAYRNLLNSVVIPDNCIVDIVPNEGIADLRLSIDGVNKEYFDVSNIRSSVSKKRIKAIRMNNYSSTKIIHDKFLS